jgi:hypothetical protein
MNNMAHGMGLIPTIQLGEGVPVDSVKVVDDGQSIAGSNNNKGVNKNSQHIDNVQLPPEENGSIHRGGGLFLVPTERLSKEVAVMPVCVLPCLLNGTDDKCIPIGSMC